MLDFYRGLDGLCGKLGALLGPLVSLLTRLTMGHAFLMIGWAKVNDLEGTTKFFESLGIPAPGILAPFIGGLELVGGGLLILGLLTRPITALLSATMIVGIVTAHTTQIADAFALDGKVHFLDLRALVFLLFLGWLFVRGAGPLSLDRVLLGGEDRNRR